MNKSGYFEPEHLFVSLMLFILISSIFALGVMIYDILYLEPTADVKANEHCLERGYDHFESYSRRGIISDEPIAIKCAYIQQYRNVDLNIQNEVRKNE